MSDTFYGDKEQATFYAKYRPTYSSRIYSIIAEYCQTGNPSTDKLDLAVDVGCGSGQSTIPLCALFKKVIGYDISDEQISCAPTDIDNLSFNVGPGEDLSFLEDDSVDLVTVAQALHWFDLSLFYPELKRVLKTGGVFAAYGYGSCIIKNSAAHDVFAKFYHGLLGQYSSEQRQHTNENYKNMDRPFENCEIIVNDDLKLHKNMTTDAFIGYLSSTSSWRRYLKQHPEANDLDQLKEKLEEICKNQTMEVYWPGFILIGRYNA